MPDRPAVATLHDVAALAGVGKSTVSNVLAGTGRVAAETRERVLAAADTLGYVPNRSARRLRGGSTGAVGVHVPGVPSRSEYYMRFVFGVLEHTSARGRDTVVVGAGERDGALPPVDGFVLSDPHDDDPVATAVLASGRPVVCFERPPAAAPPPAVVLWVDHGAALRAVLDAMHDAGARRPALLVPPETGDWAARLGDGYRRWCADHGVAPVTAALDWIPDPPAVDAAVDRVLTTVPEVDALFLAPVDTAPAALGALRRHGRTVGTDLLLATGTESTAARLSRPPVTAVDLDPLGAGRRCAELLDGLLGGTPGAEIRYPATVHLRASTRGTGTLSC